MPLKPREIDRAEDRPGDRRLFFAQQDPLDSGSRFRQAARDLLFGNVDTWLIWKLTNGASHVTDFTNASRTMLMNLAAGEWDDELLCDLRRAAGDDAADCGLVGDLRSRGGGASGQPDSHRGHRGRPAGGAVRAGVLSPGIVQKHLRHGMFRLMHTGGTAPVSKNRLLATRAASPDASPQFAIEGSVFIAGAAVQWLRDKMGMISATAESRGHRGFGARYGRRVFCARVRRAGRAALGFGGARHRSRASRRGPDRARTWCARRLRASPIRRANWWRRWSPTRGVNLKELRVDGGAAANNFLMQFQADILGSPVVRPADIETTALGAAYLAGLATGFFKSLGRGAEVLAGGAGFRAEDDRRSAGGRCLRDGRRRWRGAGWRRGLG